MNSPPHEPKDPHIWNHQICQQQWPHFIPNPCPSSQTCIHSDCIAEEESQQRKRQSNPFHLHSQWPWEQKRIGHADNCKQNCGVRAVEINWASGHGVPGDSVFTAIANHIPMLCKEQRNAKGESGHLPPVLAKRLSNARMINNNILRIFNMMPAFKTPKCQIRIFKNVWKSRIETSNLVENALSENHVAGHVPAARFVLKNVGERC